MNTARSLGAGLLLLCASTIGQAADLRPGLWEFRSTRMSLAGLPDMSAQMAEMQKQLKNLPPETQRMLQQQMASRGVHMGKDGSVRSCITPEQAKQDNIYSGRTDGGCTLVSVAKTGNTVRGRLNCTQPQGTADFETTIDGPEHFTTQVKMRSTQGDMQADTDARWFSAQCGSPARSKP
ncbi:MAG: DUF3617 domain-containing protein [Zoogloea sp.]|nr:DUF3617 domain-containing protein [Zoogloea sp.]